MVTEDNSVFNSNYCDDVTTDNDVPLLPPDPSAPPVPPKLFDLSESPVPSQILDPSAPPVPPKLFDLSESPSACHQSYLITDIRSFCTTCTTKVILISVLLFSEVNRTLFKTKSTKYLILLV